MARDRVEDDLVDLDDDLDGTWDAPLPRGGQHDDDDDEDDDGRLGRSRQLRERPRWLGSRWTLPALVVVLALVVVGAAGRQFRAAAADDLARAEQLGALQLGGASVVSAFTGDPAEFDAQGRLLTRVQVQVLNSGEEGVHVAVRGTSEPLLQLVGPQEATAVGPDGSNTLTLRAAVDCSRAPAVRTSYSSPEDAQAATAFSLDLDVAVADDPRSAQRHRYLVADSGFGWGDIGQQLAYACDPASNGSLSVSTSPRDDGTVVMEVRNETAAETTVALDATPWLGATTDVALPATVHARSDLPVVVTLHPRCSSARSPSEGGLDVRVDLVPANGDGSGQPLSSSGGLVAAWAARQVALACG
ncbi:hypothetical protein [Quadrisphaera setariae]|uniref:Uncharacterized protein n=1 Tax=Quadrisphaera setariae TaxID=2593304 RepID=A0A5C8ZE16_9ACTN|nr:hypothetical protein [Quadrisphaera setariae]TXR55539.1 hypothetical protein FMM08_14685 [Quadrisphaera setariae]